MNPLEINCSDVKARLDAGGEFFFLDCREKVEFDHVRIAGATLLPMSEITQRLDELLPHKEREIVVHCHHGVRSLQVAHWLAQQGFSDVKSMAGGIDLWAQTIEPGMTRY